ncbi:MAG: hypothetical protein LBH28_06635 [Oscillospiraceae bacterium]|jgi:hypothetical protein|nr:hypothetical protein [Oscillospiraceae bacterium]
MNNEAMEELLRDSILLNPDFWEGEDPADAAESINGEESPLEAENPLLQMPMEMRMPMEMSVEMPMPMEMPAGEKRRKAEMGKTKKKYHAPNELKPRPPPKCDKPVAKTPEAEKPNRINREKIQNTQNKKKVPVPYMSAPPKKVAPMSKPNKVKIKEKTTGKKEADKPFISHTDRTQFGTAALSPQTAPKKRVYQIDIKKEKAKDSWTMQFSKKSPMKLKDSTTRLLD